MSSKLFLTFIAILFQAYSASAQTASFTFQGKLNDAGTATVGFVAEEVKAVKPLLAVTDNNGEIQDVKYEQITTAPVNAVKEQQTQIETENQNLREQLKQQQVQIDTLKLLLCQQNQTAAVCAAPEKK